MKNDTICKWGGNDKFVDRNNYGRGTKNLAIFVNEGGIKIQCRICKCDGNKNPWYICTWGRMNKPCRICKWGRDRKSSRICEWGGDEQTMDICTWQGGKKLASFVIGEGLERTMYKREEYFYMRYVLFVVRIYNCTYPWCYRVLLIRALGELQGIF
jgi:hypothetical protein